MGFLLCAFLFPSYNGLFAFIFYIFVYITISIFLFGFLLSIRKRKSSEKIKNISELVSLANSNNYLSFSLCLVLFSLAGIPPLIGFFGKFYIFLNLIELEYYLLALILVITSVISSMYYIRLIKLMFFSKPKRYFFFENISKLKSLLISFFFLFNLFFLFFPFYLIDFFHNLILMIVL